MENELTYEIKVTLQDGSYYQYTTKYSWEINKDKLDDTRTQFVGFDNGKFITAREAILKVETKKIENDDEKENARLTAENAERQKG